MMISHAFLLRILYTRGLHGEVEGIEQLAFQVSGFANTDIKAMLLWINIRMLDQCFSCIHIGMAQAIRPGKWLDPSAATASWSCDPIGSS